MSERRLDDALAALGRARPRLDDVTRARVGARVEAALAEQAAVPPRASRRGRVAVGGAVVGAAAAVALIAYAAWPRERGPAPVARPAGEEAAPALALATGPVEVAAGESRRLDVGDTAVTVIGPGRFDGTARAARADAAALVVDRAGAGAPFALEYAGVTVVASRATFALDRRAAVRLTVMRGEVTLLCDEGPRLVRAGETARCAERAPASASTPSASASTPSDVPAASTTPAAGDPVAAPPPPPAVVSRATARPRVRATPSGSPDTPAPPPAIAPAPPPAATSDAPVAPDDAFADDAFAEPVPSSALPNLYALAEGAMRRGDAAGARAALDAVIAADATSLDAALALLDLARLAHADGDHRAAARFLDRLDRHPRRAPLAEPAARLRAALPRR